MGKWAAALRVPATVATAGVFAIAVGVGLRWSVLWVVVATLSLVFATIAARSIGRAVLSMFAALGLVAGVLWLLATFGSGVSQTLHITWGAAAFAVWLLTIGIAVCWRSIDTEASYSLAELIATWIGIAFAARLYIQTDYHGSLLRLLVHAEDNAAWVSLTRDIASQASVGPGINGALGPILPTILGVLHEFQRAEIPTYNATFSAYALAVFCLPIIVATLLIGKLGFKSLAIVAFVLVLIAWAYRVPFLLFASYGHLSAIWAVLFLIGLAAFFMRARRSSAALFVGMGLALVVGAVWFPIAALGVVAAGTVLVVTWPAVGRYARVLGIAGFVVITYILVRQLPVATGDNPAVPHETFSSLYAAQGGTAAIDATLFVVILIGVVGLSWLGVRHGRELSRASTLAICGVLYIGAVFVGAYALRVGVGYGPTKVAYVVGSAVLVVLLSAVPRFALPPRVVVAVVAVLGVGAVIYGGAGDLASRSWPGDPPPPPWLVPLESTVNTVGASSPAPIACVSSSKWSSYLCTRWGAALTAGGDAAYLEYRLAVANDGDTSVPVNKVIATGVAGQSNIVMVDAPSQSDAAAWQLIASAGQVFGPDGEPLVPRPVQP